MTKKSLKGLYTCWEMELCLRHKKTILTLLIIEVVFIVVTYCVCQGVWLRRVLEKIGHVQCKCTTIYHDNNSTIKPSKNMILHG